MCCRYAAGYKLPTMIAAMERFGPDHTRTEFIKKMQEVDWEDEVVPELPLHLKAGNGARGKRAREWDLLVSNPHQPLAAKDLDLMIKGRAAPGKTGNKQMQVANASTSRVKAAKRSPCGIALQSKRQAAAAKRITKSARTASGSNGAHASAKPAAGTAHRSKGLTEESAVPNKREASNKENAAASKISGATD